MVATSSGIRAMKFVEKFLQVDAVVAPNALKLTDAIVAVVVWGRKSTSEKASNYAKRNNLKVLYLEDGWVRSASENAHSRRSYSLLLDNQGVYYDASEPSQLEQILNQSDEDFEKTVSVEELAYAARCRKILIESNITKYNFCKTAKLPDSQKNLVLVIDQTLDDASVLLGGMNSARFVAMLNAAITENPDAEIVVRTHPDVVTGRRKGYLTAAAQSLGVVISANGDNPIPWLKKASRVYVGTSQIGYEALLCETPVSVFGQPFYAGWGLTDDRQPIKRRTAARSINQLFHVAHVQQVRYVNPVTGELWQLHECLEHVQLQQRYFDKNAMNFHCVGITPWKQGYIRQYLRSPNGTVTFNRHSNEVHYSDEEVVSTTWSFRHFSNASNADEQNSKTVRIEDGFLRSTGLGSDFTPPGSLVVDHSGLYFDPSSASDLETLLNTYDLTPADIQRAQKLRQRILAAGLSKYNVGEKSQKFAKSAVTKSVLVVGQVEDDASIQRGCDLISNNAALLEAVRDSLPDSYIVYKPHPDVLAGNRQGSVAEPLKWADEVNTTSSITAGLAWCDELHTMTSLAGFEALMRNKRVVTYGMPFYGGWGLTSDRSECVRRTRRRTLDELVYMTLVEYPRYLDIESGEFMSPETMVMRMENERLEANVSSFWMQRQVTKVANVVKGCRYAP